MLFLLLCVQHVVHYIINQYILRFVTSANYSYKENDAFHLKLLIPFLSLNENSPTRLAVVIFCTTTIQTR